MDKTRKRSHSSDVSEESESDNDAKIKRTKINDDKISDEIGQKLVRVVAKLIKDVNQIRTTFGKVAKDIDKAEDKIDKNKRNISRERMFKQFGSGIHVEMKRFYQNIIEEGSERNSENR